MKNRKWWLSGWGEGKKRIESGKDSNIHKIRQDFNGNGYSARERKENFMTEVTPRLGHEGHLRFQQTEGVKTSVMK